MISEISQHDRLMLCVRHTVRASSLCVWCDVIRTYQKVRLSFYGRSAFRQVAGPTALRATHPPITSQADDMGIGQLFGFVNHYAQERHDELISMMCWTSSRSHW